MGNTNLSIVIPNLHSPVIGRTLESLLAQLGEHEAGVEIIVVGMDRYNLIPAHPYITFIRTPTPVCAAAARNLGIVHAQGDILIFLDADCVVAPDWLVNLRRCYQDAAIQAVIGGVAFPDDEYWTLCDNISTFYNFHKTAPAGNRPYAPTLNLSVRRALVERIGLFDESFPGAAGEDIDWTLRMGLAGYTIHFNPQILVQHLPARNTWQQLLSRAYHFGRAMFKVFWRYRDVRRIPFFDKHALLFLPLAPLLGLGITVRIFFANPRLLRYWYTFPAVWLAKTASRIGVASRVKLETTRNSVAHA